MRTAVAGGTGYVGRHVVDRLRARGDDVVILARSTGVDLTTGRDLAPALIGVDAIVDTTSTTSTRARECVAFFAAIARNLQEHGARAGVRRLVTLSIVGIDGLGGGIHGHYDGKRAQEAATESGSVPTAILRATQLHGFAASLIDAMAKGGVLTVPAQPVQTVDVGAVAERLAELTTAELDGSRARFDLAGPERQSLRQLVRATATARGQRLLVVPIRLPGVTARRIRAGALLPPEGAAIDGRTFADWLQRTGGRCP